MKNTKRSLLLSALALVICVAMLIGSTFAWFTDSASTAVNTIQSGKLDVVLEKFDEAKGEWVTAEGETLKWITTDAVDNVLWEPGCTYKLPLLRVRNAGNLALKYEVEITGLKGDAKLLEVIEFTGLPTDATLTAGAANEFQIEGHMAEEAGNEYQDLKIDNIAITVYATQLAYESDSYGPDYDEDAVYYDALVKTEDELIAAVNAAKADYVIAIDGNITLTKALSKAGLKSIKFVAYSDDATIDQAKYNMHFNGAKVTFKGLTLTHGEKAYGDGGQTSTAFAVWYAKEVNYVDCTFNRSVGTIHADLHNFIRCTFNGVENPDNSKSEYPLYICSGKDYNVIDCTFNCTNRGAILFYNDAGTGVDTLNISGTKFFGDIIADKTAVEIHNNSAAQVYNVNIKDVMVGDGIINGLYRIKPANVGEVNVTVDDVEYFVEIENATELKDALANGKNAALMNDVMFEAKDLGSNGYGATGITVNGSVLDGNGNKFGAKAGATWDSAISITSGTIKNIIINDGFRGIFIKKGNAPVYLENVIVEGTTYTISCDSANSQGLEATNCTFNGWTSFAKTIGNVKFTNCNFGAGAGYNYSRPYAPTTYVGCNFAAGHKVDPRAAVTFENCTIDGQPLTAENLATLVTSNIANATVIK